MKTVKQIFVALVAHFFCLKYHHMGSVFVRFDFCSRQTFSHIMSSHVSRHALPIASPRRSPRYLQPQASVDIAAAAPLEDAQSPRPTTVQGMMNRSKEMTSKTDIVESGNAMVAEVTAFLAQRTKQRNADTMRYLELRMKMKPPPPMTMEELEQHPLAKQKAQKRLKQDREFDNAADEDDVDALPFIAKPQTDRDVMKALRNEIVAVNHEVHSSKKTRPSTTAKTSVSGSAGMMLTFGSTIGGPGWGEEDVDWKVNSARLPSRQTINSLPLIPAPPRNQAFLTAVGDRSPDSAEHQHIGSPSAVGSAASPLSVRALGPEHDKEILSRDPRELRKIRNEDRHAQYYRGNLVEQGLPSKVNPDVATTSDMELFHDKVHLHDHHFNIASLKEIERARAAQNIFRATKVDTLQRYLSDEKHHFRTPDQVLGRARRATHRSAREKDNAERLDVFFDHLDRLERFTKPSFPGHTHQYLYGCIAQTRKVVTQREGMQEYADFDTVVHQSFPPEMLLHYYVADFLRMLAAIFGIGMDRFRVWLRDALKRFDARDYEPVFRSVEIAIGKEVTKEARFKVNVIMVRGAPPPLTRTELSLRISVERHAMETALVPGATKVTWNETFSFHIYDEQSHITMVLIQDGEQIGQGSFSVFRYPIGKPSRMWFPIPGPLIPHAEVNIVVEMLPLQNDNRKQACSVLLPDHQPVS